MNQTLFVHIGNDDVGAFAEYNQWKEAKGDGQKEATFAPLPEGFEPRSVSLVATATTPRKMEAREEFPWQLKEKFTHVGK